MVRRFWEGFREEVSLEFTPDFRLGEENGAGKVLQSGYVKGEVCAKGREESGLWKEVRA